MPTKKYYIDSMPEDSKARLREVQFYLFLQSFFYKYNYNNQYVAQLIETLAELFDCRPTRISVLIANFNSPLYKPTKQEIAVLAVYLQIPVRNIVKITGMSMETYYNHLRAFFKTPHPLVARLEPEYSEEMTRFLKNAAIMFQDVSGALKGYELL